MTTAHVLPAAAAKALAHVAAMSDGSPVDRSLRVTLHFHPDRPAFPAEAHAPLGRGSGAEPPSVLALLVAQGVYRSQFETGTSNGGLTAHPGGDRWAWESRLFGGAYDDSPPDLRPVYGALNHRRRPAGGSIRFGSAHLRLSQESLARTTFCYPDSVFEPVHLAVADRMSLVALADADTADPLDDYIEAHVHGRVLLDRDVEALVLDPCFRGTEVESTAARLPFPVEWHHGLRLSTKEMARHPDYRGPEVVAAAGALAVDGHLDAAVLGQAARRSSADPQVLKRIWHYVARFGDPVEAAGGEALPPPSVR